MTYMHNSDEHYNSEYKIGRISGSIKRKLDTSFMENYLQIIFSWRKKITTCVGFIAVTDILAARGVTENINASLQTQVLCVLSVSQALGPVESRNAMLTSLESRNVSSLYKRERLRRPLERLWGTPGFCGPLERLWGTPGFREPLERLWGTPGFRGPQFKNRCCGDYNFSFCFML
ncbi:hypothetical protein TNCV_2696371 [Trichonephila clavipes]|nr:hypothetical protein TNCV_2696371 [Trichonephila clavipes]